MWTHPYAHLNGGARGHKLFQLFVSMPQAHTHFLDAGAHTQTLDSGLCANPHPDFGAHSLSHISGSTTSGTHTGWCTCAHSASWLCRTGGKSYC